MNTIEFIQNFPNEVSCESYSKAYHEKAGIYCKSCKITPKQFWFSGKKFFE